MRNNPRIGGRWALRVIAVLFAALFIAAPMTVYAAEYLLTIKVTQKFTTISPGVNSTFTYRLMPIETEPNNPMPAGSSSITGFTFNLTGNDVTSEIYIKYEELGVYHYELYQVIDVEMPGYVYDERNYLLDVYVYIDATTSAETVIYIIRLKDQSKPSNIVFENSYGYTPTDPNLMPDYSVVKTVANNPSTPEQFTFTLEAQNASNPMPAGSTGGAKTVTITGPGSATFGKWTYTQPGIYRYTVTEVVPFPAATGYTYDSSVYTITDTVTDASGSLLLSRVVTNASNAVVTSYSFINRYTPSEPTPPVGPGTGDGMNPSLYANIFMISGVLAVGAAIYLIFGGKRKKTYRRYENL